jgi:hypothetical protein
MAKETVKDEDTEEAKQARRIRAGIGCGIVFVVLLLGALLFRGCCVTFVDSYEMGYRYDARSGALSRIDRTGYILHAPFVVEIHTVDLRPMQVCINANARVLNCKLVQFNPAGLELFLSWHGRDNYDTSAQSKLNPILMSYAYDGSGKSYPFLTVIRELKPEEAIAPTGSAP